MGWDTQVDGWIDGQVDRQVDGWIDGVHGGHGGHACACVRMRV